jgi:hypothetical protein
MTATQDAPAPMTVTGLEAARTCIRAAVMYDHEGESYTAIARMLGLRDADHARWAAGMARSMIDLPEQGAP